MADMYNYSVTIMDNETLQTYRYKFDLPQKLFILVVLNSFLFIFLKGKNIKMDLFVTNV